MSMVRRREQEVVISVRPCMQNIEYRGVMMISLKVNWNREFVCAMLEICELINKLLLRPAARLRPFGPVGEVMLETLQRYRGEMLKKQWAKIKSAVRKRDSAGPGPG